MIMVMPMQNHLSKQQGLYVFPEQDLLVFFQAFLILKVVQMVVCLVLLVTVKWHLSSPWAEHADEKKKIPLNNL